MGPVGGFTASAPLPGPPSVKAWLAWTVESLASLLNPLASHCSPRRQGPGGASHRRRAGQSYLETTSWAAQRK